MNHLDPRIKTVWSLRYLIRTFFFSAFVLFYEIFLASGIFKITLLPMGYTSALVFVLGMFYTVITPILRYKYWKFDIRSDEIYIERGILTRIKTTAPFLRIQHLDVSQGVLERMLQLGSLVIYTAGTRGADVVIPGLPIEYAEALRDQLKNVTAEDAV